MQANFAPPRLSHNPSADEAERLRVRETFNLRDHLQGETAKVAEPPVVHITREQVLELCRFYGIDVIDVKPGGRDLNLEEKLEASKTAIAGLRVENSALLERCKLAEAAASAAIREMKSSAAKAAADTKNTQEPYDA